MSPRSATGDISHRGKLPAISGQSTDARRAFLIAMNIATLPSVPRQTLKDIHGRRTQPAGTIGQE